MTIRTHLSRAWRAGFWRGFLAALLCYALPVLLIAYACLGATACHSETLNGDRIVILDGDTVALPCDPLKGTYRGCSEHLRFVTVDAPETFRPRCEAERPAGLAAKARVGELLRGHQVTIAREGRDRYGRTLARLTAILPDGTRIDIEADLLANGMALAYAPGRIAWADRCRHWCGDILRCGE